MSSKKEIETVLIAAFPGTGKSDFVAANPELAIEIDVNEYRENCGEDETYWTQDIIADLPEFRTPNGNKPKFILFTSHKELRDALAKANILFYMYIPQKSTAMSYLNKCVDNGCNFEFIKFLIKNWDAWIDEHNAFEFAHKIVLGKNKTISDNIKKKDQLWDFKDSKEIEFPQ